jgi:lycopene beta-cyclase
LDDGTRLRCRAVVDSSGLESRLVQKESARFSRGSAQSIPMGYQIAYGMIATVDGLGPYDSSAMTLFDYRTDHLDPDLDPLWLRDASDKPTVPPPPLPPLAR